MVVVNKYFLKLDLKRRYTAEVPTFRRGDSSELTFMLFDDGVEFNITNATSAKIYLSTPSKFNLQADCSFDIVNGKRVIKYTIEDIAMVELGYITVLLVVFEGDSAISIQPFTIKIVDDLLGRPDTYLGLIQELLEKINNLKMQFENMIPNSEKGENGGVATSDSNGMVIQSQLPDRLLNLLEHIPHTVYQNQVHGLRINEDGVLEHLTNSGYKPTITVRDSELNNNPDDAYINVEVVEGVATVSINAKYFLAKWDVGNRNLDYFLDNGKYFYSYNKFNVDTVGIHTIYYLDFDADIAYTYTFEVTEDMLNPNSNISVSVVNGVGTVTIDNRYELTKWDFGNRDTNYFLSNGNYFYDYNKFDVDTIGIHTIYYIDTIDLIALVYTFEVTEDMLNQQEPLPNIQVTTNNGLVSISINPFYTLSKHSKGDRTIQYLEQNGYEFSFDGFYVFDVGKYSFTYYGANGVRKLYQFEVTQSMLQDIVPPTIFKSVEGVYGQGVKTGAVIVNWFYSDESGIDYIINPRGETLNEQPSPYRYTITNNGNHTIRVFDKSFNEATDTINVTNIGTPVTISQLPLGSRFSFCGDIYVLIEKSPNRNLITKVKTDNEGAFNINFDYNNSSNQFPNATISTYLSNINITGTLNEHIQINENGTWNYGYVSYINETASHTSNTYYNSKVGLLTLPQWITAVNNNWIETSSSDSEMLLSPVVNTNNQIYRAYKSDQGFINVYVTEINTNNNFRIALQVTDSAIGYI